MSDTMQPNVEVAMFILLAIVIPVVAFFGIKWLVFRPTRLTIHPAGGAFMRVPRSRRRYILFGPRLPPDPSRNRGSRSHRQRTVVVIRDLESGLHGGSAIHSQSGAANTPNASTTAISGSACSCSHDHGHDSTSEHYIADPDERELNIKRARTAARGGTAFGPVAVATADPRTNTIRAPHFIPDDVSSSAHASTVSADGGIVPATTATIDHAAKTADGRQALRRPLGGTIIRGPRGMSVRVRKASENLKKDAANDAAAANGGGVGATPGSPVVTPGSPVVTPASPVSPGSPITPSSPVGTPGSPVVIMPGTPVASGALPAPATPSSPPGSPITPASPTSSGTANTVDRATAANTAANANAAGRMTAAQANATAAANAASFEANSAIPVDPRHFANLATAGNNNDNGGGVRVPGNNGGVPVPGDFEIPAPAVEDNAEGGSSGGGRVVAFAAEPAKGL